MRMCGSVFGPSLSVNGLANGHGRLLAGFWHCYLAMGSLGMARLGERGMISYFFFLFLHRIVHWLLR